MNSSFDPGALLAHSYRLPGGELVCLRLARSRDLPAIAHLYARSGLPCTELELARLARCDPRRRLVICATALVEAAETVVGVGAIDLGPIDRGPLHRGQELALAPDALVVDELAGEGLGELIYRALIGRVSAIAQARAGGRLRAATASAPAAATRARAA
jgi:hypothetical protein